MCGYVSLLFVSTVCARVSIVISRFGFMKNSAIAVNMVETTKDMRFSTCYVTSNEIDRFIAERWLINDSMNIVSADLLQS